MYGSAIFKWSADRVAALTDAYPGVVLGGTGTDGPLGKTVEDLIGEDRYEHYEYSIYPEYKWSIGFTQRGCRLKCPFCVVPGKEGSVQEVNSIWDIWREGTPRYIHLLDNDFFGQEHWRERIEEIRAGKFRVCFNQGINVRLINEEVAEALVSIGSYDDQFKQKRVYTAWDNLKQENIVFKGLDYLKAAGVRPKTVMVYMLVGYAEGETMEDVLYRYNKLVDYGCMPFPMVYDRSNMELRRFARWVIKRFCKVVTWEEYRREALRHNRI